MIHGSTVGASDELTPETPPPVISNPVASELLILPKSGHGAVPLDYNSSGRDTPRAVSSVTIMSKSATGIDMMLDRVVRADANTLFCGRWGKAFEYQLQGTIINNSVPTLDSQEPHSTVSATPLRAILFEGCANGVGNVGRSPDRATYTLYDPDTDTVKFRNVSYSRRKGFQA